MQDVTVEVEGLRERVSQLKLALRSSYRDGYQLVRYEVHQKHPSVDLEFIKLEFAWEEILANFQKSQVSPLATPSEEPIAEPQHSMGNSPTDLEQAGDDKGEEKGKDDADPTT